MGNFVQIFLFNFHSHFLSNLERLYFGGGGEKTGGSHQNLSSFPPSTKQPKTLFSLHFSLLHFPSSLKSLQTNIASGNEVLKKTSNLLRLFNSRLYIFKIRHNNIVPSEQWGKVIRLICNINASWLARKATCNNTEENKLTLTSTIAILFFTWPHLRICYVKVSAKAATKSIVQNSETPEHIYCKIMYTFAGEMHQCLYQCHPKKQRRIILF